MKDYHAFANQENYGLTHFFQPIMSLENRSVSHYEALLRRVLPDGSAASAANFVREAEISGNIIDLDAWSVSNVIGTLAKDRTGRSHIAVNLSGGSLCSDRLYDVVADHLYASGIDPARLCLEVTETMEIPSLRQAGVLLKALSGLGCTVALDDFGAGFASYRYLKEMPFDIVKIDGSFVQGLAFDRQDQVIVKSMHDLAKDFGLKTVAEMVENSQTLTICEEMGIDLVQGYFVGKPSAHLQTQRAREWKNGDWENKPSPPRRGRVAQAGALPECLS